MAVDETNSGGAPFQSTPLPVSYKDRSAGLIIFGILTILLGCFVALLVPLMLFGQAMAAKTTGAQPPFSSIILAVCVYGALAVALVWLGIGSIMARRWARALLLIFSWSWLVIGVFVMFFLMFLVPKIMANMSATGAAGHPGMPAAAMGIVMFVMFLVDGFIFIVLPAVWTFFYNSRHVKATCETRDPVTRWTDACPLPVLAICVWLAFGAPVMLLMPIVGHGVTPFFGTFLSGLPGMIFYLVAAGFWAGAAWWLYKLDARGWWLIFIALCVFIVSAGLTFARHDITEMYRLMDYSEAQIQQMQKAGFLTGTSMCWMMVLSGLPYLGYLLYIKKFLRRSIS